METVLLQWITKLHNENLATMWGGGLFNDCAHPILTNCTFSENSAAYAGGMHNRLAGPKLSHCQFIENFALYGGGGTVDDLAYPEMNNCIFINNSTDGDGGGICCFGGSSRLTNCILWDNSANGATNENTQIYGGAEVNYSCIQGWTGGLGGTGNIGDDPLFVDVMNGDYHLKSQASHWDAANELWVSDDVNSPCIDAGDPASDWTAELWPHGKWINMGAFGGTPQASMSLSSAGNIADVSNNDIVDYTDLMMFADKWLHQEVLLPEDLDRNGIVNFSGFAIFANNWLWEE